MTKPPGFRTRILVRLMHGVFIFTRGMTLGVRAACFDAEGRIFLVRHGYVPGWYMPGGGVERGETALGALSKELREEGNLEIIGTPELLHAYYNTRVSRRDHVLFYRVTVRQTAPRLPDREIAESGFFALDALPDGVTDATARRLSELSGDMARSDYW
ncbi:NUDIX domain-containing protein [Neorhizobium alkalisoli]|uniref:ADP-ribose pyrophosphatase YjhB (NUDIX family) n=1 Tax=Neorhizobium alkalisoli TaxID=528178 RepID=A0A561QW39_9HYPH|nr:NUDIX domain-containing protein [Neorhizobium alkalisoli]TWF54601.1 ADP-ribose pyrophosphatase YjhB (NUDIX family) [Neorhizobium alkalisoli]